MAVVGRAEVVIRALTTQLKQDIQRGLQQAANDAEKQGGVAGDAWVKGFKDRIQASLSAGGLDFDVVGDSAAQAGTNAGAAFGENFNGEAEKSSGRRGGLKEAFDNAIPQAAGSGGAAGSAFSSSFSSSAAAGGGRGGGFLGGFLLKLTAFLPVIATLLSALSALASGLFAVGAAAAMAAAGGLALLPGLLGALIAVIGVAVLAFGGLGKAVKELGAEQKKSAAQAITQARAQRAAARAVENAAEAIVDAQERVGDAQERVTDSIEALERARRDAARGAVDAARRVVDAEHRIAEAHERAQRAQENLTDARKDAKETLEDLQLSLRGAVLGEQEATLRLARARQQYQETLNNPNSNAMDRAQARIDLQQAELALDTARDRRDDVTTQTEEANKAGIEGSDQVVRAKEEIDDANKALADSERDLVRAREDQAQQAIDAAERISDAQEAVRDAYKGVQDAVDGVADAQERYRDALENQRDVAAQAAAQNAALREEFNKLSPAAQRVALLIHGLRAQFRGLKQDVQEAVLPAVERLIRTFTAKGWFEVLRDGLVGVGRALGDVIDKFTDLFSTRAARDDLATFFRIAAQLTRDLGGAFVVVLRALLDLTAGAEPFFARFGKHIGEIAQKFADFIDSARNSGALKDFFDLAFRSAKSVGDAMGAIFGILKTLIVAAAPFGIILLDAFTKVTEAKNEFFKSDEGQARLNEFFTNIVPNVKAVVSFLGELLAVFIRIGENPGVKKIMDQLRMEFLPILENLINTLTNDVGPAVFKIFTDIAKVLDAIFGSAVFQFVLNMIKQISGALASLFTFEIGGVKIFAEVAVVLGSLIGVVLGFVKVVGIGIRIFTAFQKALYFLKVAIFNIRVAFVLLRAVMAANPFGAIILGVTLLVTGLILAYKKFETFRNVVDAVVKFVKDVFLGLYNFLLGNSVIPDIVNGTIEFFTALKDAVVGIFTAVKDFIVAVWDGIKAAIELVVSVIATIITTYVNIWRTIIETVLNVIKAVVTAIFNGIKAAIEFVLRIIVNTFNFYFNIFKTIFRVGFDVIKTVVSTVFNGIKTTIEFIGGGIRAFFDRFITGIKRIWEGLWNTLSSVASTVFGGIKGTIDRILGGIKTGFETTVGFVRTAWDGIREAISKPIRSVVDVAYNKGIVKFWNNVAGAVGATPLKEVKFAKGGLVPGYAPGQDRVRALLSPGEGILVPEAVRGLARQMGTTPAKAIQSINSQWTSRVPGGSGRFAGGGYVSGSTRNAWGGALDYVRNPTKIFSDSFDWILGQLAKGAKVILEGAYTLVDEALPDNKFGDMLGQAPRKIGSKILSFLERKDKESEESGSGVGGGKIGDGEVGSSYRSLVRIFKQSGLPGVVTSTVRRARFPGDQSNHMRGLAADFSGNHGNRGYGAKVLRDIFHLFANNYGKDMRELILAGAPFNIKRGKKVPGYSWGRPGGPGNHWNHVHAAAMAQGGTVLPRPGGTLALLAEAGKAESVVDTGLLNDRLRDLADARDGSAGVIRAINQQNAILERIGALGGIRIDKIEARTTSERDVGHGIARELRGLAFELGQ